MAISAAVQNTTLVGVVLQDAEPAVTDRDKVWARTSGGAPVTPFLWVFFGGLWCCKHPTPAGTPWAFPYTGTLASIDTLDGGSAGVVSSNSGPFWEAVPSLAARVPIGAGTLPSGTVLAIGDTGGEEKHTLLQTEMPSSWSNITSVLRAWRTNLETLAGQWLSPPAAGGNTQTNPATETGTFNFQNVGGDTPFNVLPPYATLTFLRRTARIYCTTPIA